MFGSTPFGSSTFGSNTSAFGSAAGTTFGSTGFGTGTTGLFGAKTTAAGTFGFGTTTQSPAGTGMFGSPAAATTGMFGATSGNAFGAAAQSTTGFGTFGTSGTTGSLFGSTTTTAPSLFSGTQSTFGNANKSVFGTSTNPAGSIFGTPAASTASSLFGAKPQTTSSLFNASTTGSLFGNTATGLVAQSAAGTPQKFVAQTSTDTMMKSGIQTSISTKHQCITLMKEYDKKSLEELRMEDYQLGRKGPQAAGTSTTGTGLFSGSSFGPTTGALQPGFGTGTRAFGTSTGTSLFGQQTPTVGTSSLFGAKTTAAGLFGNTSTTFSTPSAFTNTASTGLFGTKPAGIFGTTTAQPATGLFGATPAFGTASSGTGLFGTSTFGQTGQTGIFGATSQPSTGLFGKTSAFGTNTSGTGTSLFGTPAFGQAAQSSLFGVKSSTGSTFGTTNTGGIFGQQNKPAFGFGTTNAFGTSTAAPGMFGNTAGTGLFGNTGSLGFGTTPSLQGSTLGSTLGTTFGQTGLGNTGTGLLNLVQPNVAALQQQQLQQQLQQQVLALTSSPFGDSPLFRNLTSRTRSEKSSAVTSQPRQRGANTPSHYKVSPRPSARVKPRAIGKNGFSQARLFDGLDDENEYSSETFVPRRSIKKLVLKKKSTSQSSVSISSELGNGRVSDSETTPETRHRRESSNSTEFVSDKFYSTPKLSDSLRKESQEGESPLVGIRRSRKGVAENGSLSTDGQDKESPVIGIRKRVSLDVTTRELNSKDVDEEDGHKDIDHEQGNDDEQGPEPREGDTLEKEVNRHLDPRRCGVTLKRAEYFCNPSIAELDEMVREDGEVIVGDFVVGREGFGMVKFFGECNVTGLNLDKIVWFRRREIEVYPDGYPDKPPVGKGLNRKAEVTLYKVWPNDKTTRTPIKNPERLKMVGWLEKLETATARLGATFVDYQAETGTWIFTVDHFTRYGLKEVQIGMEDGSVSRRPLSSFLEDKEKLQEKDRLEEEDAIALKLRLDEEMADKKKMFLEKMYDEDSSLIAQDDSQMTDISQETFPEFQEPLDEDEATSPASHHLATALGVNSHRMQVMKASFFGESEITEPRDHPVDDHDYGTREFHLTNRSVLSSTTGVDEFERKSAYNRSIFSGLTTTSKGVHPASTSRTGARASKERKTDYESYRDSSQWYSLPQPILLPSVIGSPSESSLKAAGIRTQPALVPLSQSVTAGKHNLIADAGLTMGRSFRVGWGPAWTLVHSTAVTNTAAVPTSERFGREVVRGSPLMSSQKSINQRQCSSFAVRFARVNVSPTIRWDSDVSQGQLSERLQISLANCERNEDDSSPCFSPAAGVKALHEYAKVASESKEILDSSPFSESAKTFSSVLDLVVALWGNLSTVKDSMETDNEDIERGDYNSELARKESLSDWLSKISQSVINEEIEEIKAKNNNHLRIIFSLLSGKQISAACQVAQANGDSRLSLLLAQSSGNRIVRQWLLKQLDDWLEHKVDKFIPHDRLRIYALLAGDMAWRGIEVCKDLDWKRAFSLHLWYQRPSSNLIPDALASYENSFKGATSAGVYAVEPRPSYLIDDGDESEVETADSEEQMENGSKTCRDTCYHLIKLFCKRSHRLESTLAPASYTRYQLDVSLSWHLYQILQSVGYNHLSEYYGSFLNTSYAAQLEALGLWHWAIFVLLHIQDPVRREHVVRDVLVRYCLLNDDEGYSEKEAFLIDDLNVPVQWIHEAKVVRARMENRPKEEAYHLLKSGNFNLSHEVILNRLASLAIINEEYDSIKELLVEIAPRENSSLVHSWNTGGQIYLDYIKLCEKFNDIKNGFLVPTAYQLEKMKTNVSSLCHRISQLPSHTATDKLCQSDMGTMCANILKIIAKELMLQSESATVYATRSSVLAPHIQKLPLPEDCCLTELRELTSNYVDELALL